MSGTPLAPSYIGYVNTAKDALRLFEACLQGTVTMITRRPHDRERSQLIRSGSVFIYNEHDSAIKRWTDGVNWSPSRILGNFLVYRELEAPFPAGEKKRARRKPKNRASRISDPYTASQRRDSHDGDFSNMSSKSSTDSGDAPERALIGSLVDSYGFKEGGLVKRTMSINVAGVSHHLVSYYTIEDVLLGRLQTPSKDQTLETMEPRPELTLRQTWRAPIDSPDQLTPDNSMGNVNSTYTAYNYLPYRAATMINPSGPPPHQQQQQSHHHHHHHQHQQPSHAHHHPPHHGAHSAHNSLGMPVYSSSSYTTASSAPAAFQAVPLQVTLPPSSSQYHYHAATAIAPPSSYGQYDSTAHTITLPQDPNHHAPPPPAAAPPPSYHYGRQSWAAPPPLPQSQSVQSRVGSIETATPTSDGKSSEPDWQRHSHSSAYSTLASPISAQSAYAPPSTPWSAPPNPIRDDWPAYKTGQAKHDLHLPPHTPPEPTQWRQSVPCT